jgi:hypothetical protein
MSDRKITHEVKLQKSVIIILGVLAVGVMANAFAPAFSIKDAMAKLPHSLDVYIQKCSGCK